MCGIVGYIGKEKNALRILLNGLKSLEYRGYDSSGIAYFDNDKIITIKEKGKIEELEKILDYSIKSNIGIAHTRWATCGDANKTNAHPHSCGKITIVHNGIIENYNELKNQLQKNNKKFISETDSEIIAILINKYYEEYQDIIMAINKTKEIIKGSYAIAILCEDIKDKIFAIRKDSPLIIAKSKNAAFIASDVPAILNYTNKYIILNENEIAILTNQNITVLNDKLQQIKKKLLTFKGNITDAQKGNFKHFMLKEIFEEKDVIKRIIKKYNTVEKLNNKLNFLDKYNSITIIGCGSAYHVGIIAKYLIEEYANIPVNVEIASEFRYKKNFFDKKNLAIFISQSGETADTLASLREVKKEKIDTLGVINVPESSIAREADNIIYTEAGPEIAVATTKAFTAQLIIMILITLYLGYKNKTFTKDFLNSTLTNIDNLEEEINNILNKSYKEIASKIAQAKNIFFLGRNIDYGIALEGSLKLKEISYIHSEAYPAGELKHGTISLIEKNMPVISIITKEHIFDKTISNIKETKARGSFNIVISNKQVIDADINILVPDVNPILQPILVIIILQLISYETANLKGCDIDKPRNLAKSVTVE